MKLKTIMDVRHVGSFFSCFVILCVSRHSVLALKRQCYSCSSCDDNKPESFSVTSCRGSCMKWSGVNANNAKTIERGCFEFASSSFTADSEKCMTSERLGIKGQLCVCNDSKCNGARTVTMETPAMLLPLVTLLAVMRKYCE